MKCLIAILIPEEIAKEISSIQQKYKNEEWNIALPPHITLVPPMEVTELTPEMLEALEKETKVTGPFNIDLKEIGHFQNEYFVIYQNVEVSPSLAGLADELTVVSKTFAVSMKEYKEFHPHMTLSNDLNEEEFKDRYPRIEKKIVERSFVCNRIALLLREQNEDKWKIENTFELG